MTEDETRMILSQVSALDNRRLNDAVLVMWFQLFNGYSFAEVKWAVLEHARTSTDYLMPAHLTSLIHQKRAEYRMMNPAMEFASRDAWLEFEHMQVLASREAAAIRATAIRSAVEAMDSGEFDGE